MSKDSKWRAIIGMNGWCLGVTTQGVLFKIVAKEGFSIIEFVFFRCVFTIVISVLWSFFLNINPFKNFPWEKKWVLCMRIITGHVAFTLLNIAITLSSLSLVMVILQTNPFWLSIIAFCILSEPIIW